MGSKKVPFFGPAPEVANTERTQTRPFTNRGGDATLRDEVALEDDEFLEKLAVFAEAENGRVVDEEITREVNPAKVGETQGESLDGGVGDRVGGVVGETEVEVFEEREAVFDEGEIGVCEGSDVGTGEGLQRRSLLGQITEPIGGN